MGVMGANDILHERMLKVKRFSFPTFDCWCGVSRLAPRSGRRILGVPALLSCPLQWTPETSNWCSTANLPRNYLKILSRLIHATQLVWSKFCVQIQSSRSAMPSQPALHGCNGLVTHVQPSAAGWVRWLHGCHGRP